MALAATAHKVPTGMVNALEGPRITGKGGWTGGVRRSWRGVLHKEQQ